MSTGVPFASDVHVRRPSRTDRHGLFSRRLFRYPGRRRHSTLAAHPPSEQDPSSVPQDVSFSSFFFRHRHHSQQTPRDNQPKPIYIYPGLLRIFRDKAIALDNQCPAVLYKCRECRRDQKLSIPVSHDPMQALAEEGKESSRSPEHQSSTPTTVTKCPHQTSCAICLEEFHGKDLVRKLPCNTNHVFHSKCILDWFISKHHCPLCNESITRRVQQSRLNPKQSESRREPNTSDRAARDTESQAQKSESSRQPQQPNRRFSNAAGSQPATHDQSHGQSSVQQRHHDAPDTCQKPASSEKGKKKQRGPRTYSYIVHDRVRMDMNLVIPA